MTPAWRKNIIFLRFIFLDLKLEMYSLFTFLLFLNLKLENYHGLLLKSH